MTGARARIAACEAGLIRAALIGGELPAGADAARVKALGTELVRKRARNVARAWPAVARALGGGFEPRFAEFAKSFPAIPTGGGLVDGRQFARFLQQRQRLPDIARVQTLAFDLRYRVGGDRMVARRWAVRAALLRKPRRLVVGIRLPGAATRVVLLPRTRWPRPVNDDAAE